MKTLIIFTVFCLALIASNSFASPPIIGGEVDDKNNNNGVFQLFNIYEDPNVSSDACTATKISENLIALAAHCVQGNKIKSFGLSNKTYNTNYEATPLVPKKIHIHPSYEKSKEDEFYKSFTASDIAIIEVEPSEEFKKLEIIPIDYGIIGDNEAVEYWGYGCQATINNLNDYSPVRKKTTAITQSKKELCELQGILTDTIKAYSKEIYKYNILTPGKAKNVKNSSLCLGDSGGPVLRNGKLVGINTSYTFDNIDDEGESKNGISYYNLHSRISAVQSWLKQILNS